MKTSSRTFVRKAFPLALSIAAAIPQLHAATVVKDNDTDALNLTTSWVGGAVPTNADVAEWNNTVAGANTVALGGNLNWQGRARRESRRFSNHLCRHGQYPHARSRRH